MPTRRAGLPATPGAWADQAACKGWGQDDFADDLPERPTQEARSRCAGCPVREDCLAFALAQREVWGLWGGLTTRERRRLVDGDRGDVDAARPYIGVHGPRKTPPPARVRQAVRLRHEQAREGFRPPGP